MFQLLLLRGYRSLPANGAAHFLAFGCGASSLIWFDLTLMSLQVVKRSNTLSEWELFFNVGLAVLLVQLCSLVIEDSEKWLLDILKPERRVLSGDSKSNGGTWFVIFSIRNKYFPQFDLRYHKACFLLQKNPFYVKPRVAVHYFGVKHYAGEVRPEYLFLFIVFIVVFFVVLMEQQIGLKWSPKANHVSRCYSAFYLLRWKLLSDALWWLGTGGVWREGDAGEEQRHLQRRHPEHAEGEQVGVWPRFAFLHFYCWITHLLI